MNFTINQTFTLTTDDQQQLTYTVKDIDESGRLLVHSSLLERAYFVSREAFADFLRVIGTIDFNNLYRIYYINFGYYSTTEYQTFDMAVNAGKNAGFEFRVELGGMVCATWSPLGGLRVMTEYQQWAQDQQYMLSKVEGSYP